MSTVLEVLERGGHRAFVVGGAVRDAHLGRPVKDFDIATSATPDEVEGLFKGRAQVVPTGRAHGTMTVVTGGTPVEVTTFRRDVATDGRRAVVAFSTRIEDDAARRDFTINALYLDRAGQVLDPTGGLADLKAGRLRFIGDADQRIREDYLRALRFFRFFAEYADAAGGFDTGALDAISRNLGGLGDLSIERVTGEILRLLAARDPGMAVAGMEKTGVLPELLPGAATAGFFEFLHLEGGLGMAPDGVARLAALGGGERLRLSRVQERQLRLLIELRGADAGLAEIAWRHGGDVARSVACLRAAGLSAPLDATHIEERIALGTDAILPIAPRDLMPGFEGAALGRALERATRAWIASDFRLDRDALLAIAEDEG